MTTVDMDKASIELANAAAGIAERYSLTASALFYVLKGLETQIADARVAELLSAPQESQQEEPKNEPLEQQEQQEQQEQVVTMPRNHASMEMVKEIIAEKLAAGDVDAEGRAHCTLREAAERTAARDNANT